MHNLMLAALGKKRCCGCNEPKPLAEFSIVKKRPDGLSSECKQCAEIRIKKWRSEKLPHRLEYNKKIKEQKRSKSDPRFMVMLKLAGSRVSARNRGHMPCTATIDELEPLFTTKCCVCSTECGNKICIDHCHTTGKFRGFICNRCNTILGCAQDSIDHLVKMILYLKASL